MLDHRSLGLGRFAACVLVRYGDRLHRVGDPRRVPTWAPSTLLSPIGSLRDKVGVARTAATAALTSPDALLARPGDDHRAGAPRPRAVADRRRALLEPAVVLDAERGGPVANTVVLTNAAPSYAPGRHLVSSSVVRGDAGEAAVRAHLARLYGVDTSAWEHVACYDVPDGVPGQRPPMGRFRRAVRLEHGLYVCGDHRDSGSSQGALVSGRRAASAVLHDLRERS